MKKLLPISILLITSLSYNHVAAEVLPDDDKPKPVYECSPEELHSYVMKNTVAERQPSPVPTADEVKDAINSAKAEEGSENCLALWNDINLQEKFNEAIQSIKDIDLTMGGDMISSIMDGIKSTIESVWEGAMDELTEQICNLIDPNTVSDVINEKVEDRYGFDLANVDGSVNDLVEDEMENQFGNKADYIYSPDKIEDDTRSSAKDEVRNYSEDFWKGI